MWGNHANTHRDPAQHRNTDRRHAYRRVLDRFAYWREDYEEAKASLAKGSSANTRKHEAGTATDHGNAMPPRRDPRENPAAKLEDFVRRINRIGFPTAQRADYPIWCVEDIRWAAKLTEKLFRELQELGWRRHDMDPLGRVLQARMSVIDMAHALRLRTSNIKARQIVRRLPPD